MPFLRDVRTRLALGWTVCLLGACGGSDSTPSGDAADSDGGTTEVNADGATMDVAGDQAARETAGESPTAQPGKVSGLVVNGTLDSLRFPEGIRFRISVEGLPDLVTTAVWREGQYRFELDGVPAGARTLVLQELNAEGRDDSWDLFQAASRRSTVEVPGGATATAELVLRAHWQPYAVDAAGAIRSCDGIRQLAFHSPTQGALLLHQEDGDGLIADRHSAVLVTSDGGRNWSVATKQMVPGVLHTLSSGNWFGGHPLLFLPGGQTALSLPQFGPVARTTDGGASWQPVAIPAPTWGPGFVEWTGIARSGNSLFVPVWTGGVQSSSVRTSLHRSDDAGATWQTILDRCDRNEPEQPCANSHHPTLPVGFAGVDVGCGPAGHCVVVGKTTVLFTTDGFATWGTFPVLPPGFGCSDQVTAGRVYWIPGTSTGWVVAPESACGTPRPLRRVTTDGGNTWGDWEPSPVSVTGDLQFGDAQTGFALEARAVSITRDGGKTFRHTGAPPHDSSSNSGLRLSVVGPDHAWVSGVPVGGCQTNPHVWVAAWRP